MYSLIVIATAGNGREIGTCQDGNGGKHQVYGEGLMQEYHPQSNTENRIKQHKIAGDFDADTLDGDIPQQVGDV
jgi:hypothetical protein